MSAQISRRTGVRAGLFVIVSAVVVLFGPLGSSAGSGTDGWSTVWGEGSAARWLVIAVAALALGALRAGAVGERKSGTMLAWAAVIVALPAAMSVGLLMMPSLVVVLVVLMRSAPSAFGTPGTPR